jgi:DNA-binding NtrC family response regulator
MKPGVLFVTPHSQDADLLSRMLSPLPLHLEHVADFAHLRAKMQDHSYRVILTESTLPDGTWLAVLELARVLKPSPEVIVTQALADARFWSEALNLGAYDLIPQPFGASEVRRILSNACSRPLGREVLTATL